MEAQIVFFPNSVYVTFKGNTSTHTVKHIVFFLHLRKTLFPSRSILVPSATDVSAKRKKPFPPLLAVPLSPPSPTHTLTLRSISPPVRDARRQPVEKKGGGWKGGEFNIQITDEHGSNNLTAKRGGVEQDSMFSLSALNISITFSVLFLVLSGPRMMSSDDFFAMEGFLGGLLL